MNQGSHRSSARFVERDHVRVRQGPLRGQVFWVVYRFARRLRQADGTLESVYDCRPIGVWRGTEDSALDSHAIRESWLELV